MPVIKLTSKEWLVILKQLKTEYKMQPAVFLMREVMKRELGFTTRYHRHWVPVKGTDSYNGLGDWIEEVHLDFYDESASTLFRLKYL
jgi:hypothetical protein